MMTLMFGGQRLRLVAHAARITNLNHDSNHKHESQLLQNQGLDDLRSNAVSPRIRADPVRITVRSLTQEV